MIVDLDKAKAAALTAAHTVVRVSPAPSPAPSAPPADAVEVLESEVEKLLWKQEVGGHSPTPPPEKQEPPGPADFHRAHQLSTRQLEGLVATCHEVVVSHERAALRLENQRHDEILRDEGWQAYVARKTEDLVQADKARTLAAESARQREDWQALVNARHRTGRTEKLKSGLLRLRTHISNGGEENLPGPRDLLEVVADDLRGYPQMNGDVQDARREVSALFEKPDDLSVLEGLADLWRLPVIDHIFSSLLNGRPGKTALGRYGPV
jgi:hypothetical protein